MSRLDDLIEHHPVPSLRPLTWVIMIVLGVLIVWASAAQLDEVASADGEVVPRGQIKVIQHLEGGIIDEIYVTEGSMVHEGDPLVQLDLASSGANKEEFQARLDGLRLTLARLDAEANRQDLVFPEEEAARRPDLLRTETASHEARRQELESTLSVLRQLVRQRALEIEEFESKKVTLQDDLKLSERNFKISEDLLEQGLTTQVEHLENERELSALKGEIKTLDVSISRARSAQSEAREREREEGLKFRRAALEEFSKTEQAIARTREQLQKAEEQVGRTQITSPIDGIVKNMRYNTSGNVVQPGEPIMEIVPSGDNLVVEAKLNPVDRGYVEEGQNATVKVSTYDFVRYGGLEGRVAQIAPDTNTGDDGMPYYRVIVETEKSYLGSEEGSLPITPGMEAIVDIHTGSRSVLDFLIRPVLKLQHDAFRER